MTLEIKPRVLCIFLLTGRNSTEEVKEVAYYTLGEGLSPRASPAPHSFGAFIGKEWRGTETDVVHVTGGLGDGVGC